MGEHGEFPTPSAGMENTPAGVPHSERKLPPHHRDCRHSKNPNGGNPPQSKTRVVRVRENAAEFVGKAHFKHESDSEVGK